MKVLKWTQDQDQAGMFKKSFLTRTKCPHRLWHLWKKLVSNGGNGRHSFQCSNDAHFPHLLCGGVALSAPEQSPDWLYRNFDRGQLFHWNSSNIVASWKVNLTRSYSQSYGGSSFNTKQFHNREKVVVKSSSIILSISNVVKKSLLICKLCKLYKTIKLTRFYSRYIYQCI